VQHRKRKSTKKINPQIEDLPTDFPDVELVKFMERTIKTGRPMKVKLNGSRFNYLGEDWIDVCYPKWKETWQKRGLKLKYNARQHCFFLKYSKDLKDAYQVFLKYSR